MLDDNMLKDLEKVDWSSLSHAYGKAVDVPRWLRAFAEGSEEERENAFAEWSGSIIHQGTYSTAAVAVVPFLVEIATNPATWNREDILDELHFIADGWSAIQKSNRLACRNLWDGKPIYGIEDAELEWKAYQQVVQRQNELSALLLDSSPRVREAIAFLLSSLTTEWSSILARLLDALDEETEPRCRTAYLLAMMDLMESNTHTAAQQMLERRMLQHFESAEDTTEKLAAGIAMLQLGCRDHLQQVISFAKSLLVACPDPFDFRSWFYGNDLFRFVVDALQLDRSEQYQWIIDGIRHPEPEVVSKAMRAAESICGIQRSAPEILVSEFVRWIQSHTSLESLDPIRWLSSMGNHGLAALESLSHDTREEVRKEAADCLQRFHRERLFYEKGFEDVALLGDEDPDELLQEIRKLFRSGKYADVERVRNATIRLGLISRNSQDSKYADRLELTEDSRRQVVEILQSLLEHDNRQVQVAAVRALWRATNDANRCLPWLLKNWLPDYSAMPLFETLNEMGPAAKDALPSLRALVETDQRCVRAGWIAGVCHLDESICAGAAKAIASIQGNPG